MGYAHLRRQWSSWRAGLSALAVLGLAALGALGLAAPAAADVSISPTTGTQGGGARLIFRVTNDLPTATITRIEVRLPTDARIPEAYPIAVADWAPSVSVRSVDGNPANDVPAGVTWIAMPGRELKPGASTELQLSMGPLPMTEQLRIEVLQTGSDGAVVSWTGEPGAAAATPGQRPAFILPLGPPTAAAGDPQAASDADDTAGAGRDWSGRSTLIVILLVAAATVFGLIWQRRHAAVAGSADPATEPAGTGPAKAGAAKTDAAKAGAAARPGAATKSGAAARPGAAAKAGAAAQPGAAAKAGPAKAGASPVRRTVVARNSARNRKRATSTSGSISRDR